MKRICGSVFLLFVCLSGFASASDSGAVLDILQHRLPPTRSRGVDQSGDDCVVSIEHSSYNDNSDFQLSVSDGIRLNSSTYRLNVGPMTGGRGDCPEILNNSSEELRIINRSVGPPCFSSSKKSNPAGLVVHFRYSEIEYIVTDIYETEQRSCTVQRSN